MKNVHMCKLQTQTMLKSEEDNKINIYIHISTTGTFTCMHTSIICTFSCTHQKTRHSHLSPVADSPVDFPPNPKLSAFLAHQSY